VQGRCRGGLSRMVHEEPNPELPATGSVSADNANGMLAQAWELYFRPEIERRQTEGVLPVSFELYMAQALLSPDGNLRVLLNEETKGEGLLRAFQSIQKGEPLYSNDLRHIERLELPDELLDSAHFTIVRAGEGWHMFFNFLSGRAKAKDMLELAREFLEAALCAKDKGHGGPAVDFLFSANELISKAELLLHRSPAGSSRTHGSISTQINLWGGQGTSMRHS
jgi:hypothetical protein